MAQSGDTGVTTYAGVAVILLLAIGALLLFKFNLFNMQGMFATDGDHHSRIPVDDPIPGGDGGPEVDKPLTPGPKPDTDYSVKHDKPLPKKLAYTKQEGDYKAEIELCLVPQGWFLMGENDGVRSNQPQRWVWLDDYYIATTEMTNEQMFAFILADGYRNATYWATPGAFKFVREHVPTRGTPDIGWMPLERGTRAWALSSPHGQVTLETLDKDLVTPVKNMQMLVLPAKAAWVDFFDYDRSTGAIRIKERETWQDINGVDVSKEEALKRWCHTTGMDGRLQLNDLMPRHLYIVISWPDGLTEPPVIGDFFRGTAGGSGSAKMPATGMSWFEADACCRYFDGSLPSEAQWEKAGRSDDGRLFPWGNELQMDHPLPVGTGNRLTTPHANLNRREVEAVGGYASGVSPYGVMDLVGNVSEWCRDVYKEVPDFSERNPVQAGGTTERRVERGSSTEDDDPQIVKLHNRRSSDPYARLASTRGFRMVMDVDTALKLGRPK